MSLKMSADPVPMQQVPPKETPASLPADAVAEGSGGSDSKRRRALMAAGLSQTIATNPLGLNSAVNTTGGML